VIAILFTAFAALIVSAPLVEGIRRWTLRRALIDVPNERSSHTTPTPRGGGIAISGLTLLGFGIAAAIWHFHGAAAFLAGAFVVAAVSFADDVRSLGAAPRFLAQTAAAALIVIGCGWWRSVAIGELSLPLGAGGVIVTVVWIAGLTNAYNFMDGIDGIAGVQAVIAAAGWIVIGRLTGNAAMAIDAALVAGTSLGFLIRNWPPARIFMGDVGAAFLGFTFAAMPFLGEGLAPRLAIPALLLVWPFVFDTTLTFFRRLHRRENIFRAHRSHLYQRLNIAGYSHRFVTMLYGAFALFSAALAVLSLSLDARGIALALAAALLAGGGIWRFVLHAERRQPRSSAISAAMP
jgi:UDP-N-acetylmuramyl pentapeptide phosphotransferase/UDP-N-acetylglucosamine-1-phosphate transferase